MQKGCSIYWKIFFKGKGLDKIAKPGIYGLTLTDEKKKRKTEIIKTAILQAY